MGYLSDYCIISCGVCCCFVDSKSRWFPFVFKGSLAVVLDCFYVIIGLLIVMSVVRCFI